MSFSPADDQRAPGLAGGDFTGELSLRGLPVGGALDAVNLTHPEWVRDIASVFVDAGITWLVTLTGQANTLNGHNALGTNPDLADLHALNGKAAALMRRVCDEFPDRRLAVVGRMGPPGRLLGLSEIAEDEIIEAYRQQAEALTEGGADVLLCDQFSELESLLAAIEGARTASGLPIVAGCTFDSGPQFQESTLGVTLPQAASALAAAEVATLVYHSGVHPDALVAGLQSLRKISDLPIWAAAPAGSPELHEGTLVYSDDPKTFATRVLAAVQAGATIFCCGHGATPDHVAAASSALRADKRGRPRPRSQGG